jgi:hypothetical protein
MKGKFNMAKKKDQAEEKPVPVRKNIKFIARYKNYSVSVPKVDADGNVVYQKNNQGQNVIDSQGNKFPVMITIKFETKETSPSKGYLSVYEWKASNESKQNDKILEVLLKKDADEGVGVETEDKYDKRTNPKAYAEKQKVQELEGKLSEMESEFNDVDALQKRLDDLLGK